MLPPNAHPKMHQLPVQPPQQSDATAVSRVHGPMSQQEAGDSHGHEMHPQKLVRLVGCHDPHAGKHEGAR
jgi:hypothetical protein